VDITVEISSIDTSYQHCRLRHGPSEKRMLCSIMENGIQEPLIGVVQKERNILLDGFKRYRCAKKAGIDYVVFRSIGSDEAEAIVALLRLANAKSLSFFEQARLIDELRESHKLSVSEIARRLERSSAWVSVRQGLTSELTPFIFDKIMGGDFPMYAYLSSVRPIMRINSIKPTEIEDFVRATSNKGLTVRDIDILAKSYFRGGDDFRKNITEGNINWCLDAMKAVNQVDSSTEKSDEEKKIIIDLEIIHKRLRRVPTTLARDQNWSPSFLAESHLICGGILRFVKIFSNTIKEFHDKTRPQKSDSCPARGGSE
jgi:ParB/RepB/Spo0J family partition protein